MVIDRRYNKPVGSPNKWKARLVRAQRQVRENPFSKILHSQSWPNQFGLQYFSGVP
jgi:hypothetical protein